MARTNHLRISALALALVLALAAVVLASLVAKPALAGTTITVNSTDDEYNADGDCSLREALHAANTNTARDACRAGGTGTDTINVPRGTYVTATDTTDAPGEQDATVGDLDITSPTIINGAGARQTTVAGIPPFDDQIFENGETTSTIRGLGITGGNGFVAGGVENNTGTLTLDQVAIYGNVSSFGGGGVASYANSSVDTLTIRDSTVWANHANDSNGGVSQQDGTAYIINSTISGNHGHGVTANDFDSGDGEKHFMYIQSSTIANNNIGNPPQEGVGIRAEGLEMEVYVKNTIVSNNDTKNCDFFGGKIISQGNNIDSADTCGFAKSTDKRNTDPRLGPLENNGGPTDTRALQKGSPAINAGGKSFLGRDQRGVKRPQGNRSDIGAYEKK